MTAELKKLIEDVEGTGLKVIGVVNDMGGKNRKVWRELDVTMECTCFVNPVDSSRRIWVFFDVPHRLKLLRNHFLDSGFTLEDGTVITKNEIEKMR